MDHAHRARSLVLVSTAVAVLAGCSDSANPPGHFGPYRPSFAPLAPSTATLTPTGDTWLGLDSTSHGTDTIVNLYTWPTNQIANAILMRFDLSSIPAGAAISSATLNVDLVGYDSTADSTYTVRVQPVIHFNPVLSSATGTTYDGVNRWTANSCCFGNVPLAQADIGAAVDSPHVNRTAGFKQWNVTPLVQGWFSNPATNFGLLLNSDPSKAADHWRYFASTRYANTAARPYLSVVYSTPSASWPNDPYLQGQAGWSLIDDYGMSAFNDSGWFNSNQWQIDSGYISVASDPSAPRSPSSVWQFYYKAGTAWLCGSSPGREYFPFAPVKQLYFGQWIKFSNPFPFPTGDPEVHTSYAFSKDTIAQGIVLDMTADGSLRLVSEYNNVLTNFLPSQSPHWTLGTWHQVEHLYDYNARTAKIWIDGTLSIDATSVPYPADTGFYIVEGSLDWGGCAPPDNPPYDAWIWLDHAHVTGHQ